MMVEGSLVVEASLESVWEKLRDPDIAAGCVPGCSRVVVLSPTSYRAEILVNLGPVRADFEVEVEVLEEIPGSELRSRLRGVEMSGASTVSAESRLRLLALDAGRTTLLYHSDVSVVGRLGRFGLGVMRKKVQKMGEAFARRLAQQVAA